MNVMKIKLNDFSCYFSIIKKEMNSDHEDLETMIKY